MEGMELQGAGPCPSSVLLLKAGVALWVCISLVCPPPSVGCTERLAFLFSGRMGTVPHQQGNVDASIAWIGLGALTGAAL